MKPGNSREAFVHWPLNFAMAARPVIFLPRHTGNPDEIAAQAVIAHERVHHRQQRASGLFRFVLAYYFSRRFRWRIERAGYRREFAVYLKHGRQPNAAAYAKTLSGRFYAWMVSYEEALAWCSQTLRSLSELTAWVGAMPGACTPGRSSSTSRSRRPYSHPTLGCRCRRRDPRRTWCRKRRLCRAGHRRCGFVERSE